MKSASYIIDLSAISLSENNGVDSSWVHALPIGNYKHPVYGTINIDASRAKNFAEGVVSRVRGIDLSINYNHNNEEVAAGWVKNAESRVDGVWLFVEWVKDAAQAIKDKKWRYFSSEFVDEWMDSQGKKFKDVMMGGALTNRPYMKNLVPINLSEETYELAFGLVSTITGTDVESLKGGKMELSESDLNKIVEGLATKLAEAGKPADPATPPVADTMKSLLEMPEIKQLADDNPIVKLLVKTVEDQKLSLVTSAESLKLAEINSRLKDFDNSKIILTPVARDMVKSLAEKLPTQLSEDFWKLLTEMKKGNTFLVELGERAGATVNYGSHKTAFVQLTEIATGLRKDNKDLSETDAFDMAISANPSLYARYRSEQMEGIK